MSSVAGDDLLGPGALFRSCYNTEMLRQTFALSYALLSLTAQADLSIEREISGPMFGDTGKMKFSESYDGTRQRVDLAMAGAKLRVAMYDDKKREFFVVNDKEKSYSSFLVDDLKKMMEQSRQMMASQAGGGAAAQKATLEKKGTKKVGRWSCTVYEAKAGGERVGEACFATFADVGITEADLGVMRRAGELQDMMPGGNGGNSSWMYNFQYGFPVQSVSEMQHPMNPSEKVKTEMIVLSIDKKAFAKNHFDMPANYKKTAPPLGFPKPPKKK